MAISASNIEVHKGEYLETIPANIFIKYKIIIEKPNNLDLALRLNYIYNTIHIKNVEYFPEKIIKTLTKFPLDGPMSLNRTDVTAGDHPLKLEMRNFIRVKHNKTIKSSPYHYHSRRAIHDKKKLKKLMSRLRHIMI